MIFIDRTTVNIPKKLLDKKSRGRKETAKAIRFYRIASNKTKSFAYSVYKDNQVKEALKKLFNGKCGYCESQILLVSTGDIEHFRPKGGFLDDKGDLQQPGYYWLAANWNNLLLSCSNCNRTNSFYIIGKGKLTVGKLNQFPLSNEIHRIRKPLDDFNNEELYQLLLDPCKDNPSKHLIFHHSGLILPKKLGRGRSKKGKHSIDVYALQRKELVEARETLVIKIKAQIKSVENSIYMQNLIGIGVNPIIDQSLIDEVETLKNYLNDNEPFLALAHQLIDPFINSII